MWLGQLKAASAAGVMPNFIDLACYLPQALSWTETDSAGQADLLRLLATKAELANRLLALLAVKRKLKAMVGAQAAEASQC